MRRGSGSYFRIGAGAERGIGGGLGRGLRRGPTVKLSREIDLWGSLPALGIDGWPAAAGRSIGKRTRGLLSWALAGSGEKECP